MRKKWHLFPPPRPPHVSCLDARVSCLDASLWVIWQTWASLHKLHNLARPWCPLFVWFLRCLAASNPQHLGTFPFLIPTQSDLLIPKQFLPSSLVIFFAVTLAPALFFASSLPTHFWTDLKNPNKRPSIAFSLASNLCQAFSLSPAFASWFFFLDRVLVKKFFVYSFLHHR